MDNKEIILSKIAEVMSRKYFIARKNSEFKARLATNAIKDNLIPPELTSAQVACTYASEADMLNVVLFGKTARPWKDENPSV